MAGFSITTCNWRYYRVVALINALRDVISHFLINKGLRVFVCKTRTSFTGGAEAHDGALEMIIGASFGLIRYETIEVI